MVAVWLGSVAAAVYHILAHRAPLAPTVLGQGGLFAAATTFGVAGYMALGRLRTADEQRAVARRTIVFFVGTGVVSGLYATHQYLSPEAVLSPEGVVFQALIVGLIGGMFGMYVGVEKVRLARERERAATLNGLYEIIQEITRAVVNQSTRGHIERTVCEQLAASGSYAFAWVGTVQEPSKRVVPRASANAEAYLADVTVTADDSPTGQGPTGRAVRTNEPQVVLDPDIASYEPWADAAGERGVNAAMAIPISHEGEQFGVLNVYTRRGGALGPDEQAMLAQIGDIMGLAIAAVEHEAELADERERLEFLNRLIRHNVLNGLNLVGTRSELIAAETDSDTVREHVELIRTRVHDLSELVDRMRTLMDAIVNDIDHELSWVPLVETLEGELSLVRQAHEDAEFRFDPPEEDPHVLADRLLGEVFENLLHNAVEHNDAEAAVVEVSVAETSLEAFVDAETRTHAPSVDREAPGGGVERVTADAVTVTVADNGPGIPSDERAAVLETGVSQLDEPGSGFGLYLVKEMVSSYGGDLDIVDSDLGGTAFEVTLLTERPGDE